MIVLRFRFLMYPKMDRSTFSRLLIHTIKDKHNQRLDLSQKSVIILKKKKKL